MKTIAITVGDPSGIGPEIALKAVRDPRVRAVCTPVLYGPHTAEQLTAFPVGVVNAAAAHAAYDAIARATADALEGTVSAVVTAPISKEALSMAGYPWRGHTDLLAHLCGTPNVAMMFWSEKLRVVLATVHIALADVPSALTHQCICDVVSLTARSLPMFGITAPRLAMAGVNPHAGEHGVMGDEEDRVIRPALAALRASGIDIEGPFPGDTVFVRASRGEFDAVIACYHDQGLIPVKLIAFGSAVNVTLGLPIVRTSVDHGTAFDIAGRGIADHGSLVEAVLLAARLVS